MRCPASKIETPRLHSSKAKASRLHDSQKHTRPLVVLSPPELCVRVIAASLRFQCTMGKASSIRDTLLLDDTVPNLARRPAAYVPRIKCQIAIRHKTNKYWSSNRQACIC